MAKDEQIEPLYDYGLHSNLPEDIAEAIRSIYREESEGRLPREYLGGYFKLLRERGYPIRALANAVGRWHQIVQYRIQIYNELPEETRREYDYSAYPSPEAKRSAHAALHTEGQLLPEVVAEMQALQKEVSKYRRRSATDHERNAIMDRNTERLSYLIDQERKKQVSWGRIAKVLGITPLGVRLRQIRHGYLEPTPSTEQLVIERFRKHPDCEDTED